PAFVPVHCQAYEERIRAVAQAVCRAEGALEQQAVWPKGELDPHGSEGGLVRPNGADQRYRSINDRSSPAGATSPDLGPGLFIQENRNTTSPGRSRSCATW